MTLSPNRLAATWCEAEKGTCERDWTSSGYNLALDCCAFYCCPADFHATRRLVRRTEVKSDRESWTGEDSIRRTLQPLEPPEGCRAVGPTNRIRCDCELNEELAGDTKCGWMEIVGNHRIGNTGGLLQVGLLINFTAALGRIDRK